MYVSEKKEIVDTCFRGVNHSKVIAKKQIIAQVIAKEKVIAKVSCWVEFLGTITCAITFFFAIRQKFN